MMIIKVSLNLIIYMPGAGHIIRVVLYMYLLFLFLPLDTGDFLQDDDYQGITKLHNLYA